MKHSKRFLAAALSGAMIFGLAITACSNSSDSEEEETFIGTKAPEVAKEVGDIVFNDGSAMPYKSFSALSGKDKKEKKASAIALIFYKGTDLNSEDDTTTSRTLGVGLKHSEIPLAWCTKDANGHQINITTLLSPFSGTKGDYTFTGDKNGSDNLEQIGAFLSAEDSGTTDDTIGEGADKRYPAFYFAKNYSSTAKNLGTKFANGWYLPTFAEIFQIYANGKGENKVFDIEAAIEELDGDTFGDKSYRIATQYENCDFGVYIFDFDGSWGWYHKDCTQNVCAIREFN